MCATITHSLANGASILKAKEMAGHATSATTQWYLHDLDALADDAVDYNLLTRSTFMATASASTCESDEPSLCPICALFLSVSASGALSVRLCPIRNFFRFHKLLGGKDFRRNPSQTHNRVAAGSSPAEPTSLDKHLRRCLLPQLRVLCPYCALLAHKARLRLRVCARPGPRCRCAGTENPGLGNVWPLDGRKSMLAHCS